MLYLAVRHEGKEVGRRELAERVMISMREGAASSVGECVNESDRLILPYDQHVGVLTHALIGVVIPKKDVASFMPMLDVKTIPLRVGYERVNGTNVRNVGNNWVALDGNDTIVMSVKGKHQRTLVNVFDWDFILNYEPDPLPLVVETPASSETQHMDISELGLEVRQPVGDSPMSRTRRMNVEDFKSKPHISRWQRLCQYLSTVHLPGSR